MRPAVFPWHPPGVVNPKLAVERRYVNGGIV
jgi:hypothetical protein